MELFKLNNYLDNYPIVEYLPTLPDETISDGKIIQKLNIESTGALLYRRRTADRKNLVQLQGNKFYFNWIRTDEEPVGLYSGFESNFIVFKDTIAYFNKVLNRNIFDGVESYELTYQDRFSIKEYIDDLEKISNYINIQPICLSHISTLNSFNYNESYLINELNGDGRLSLSTIFNDLTNEQLLVFQSVIRGKFDNFDDWFDKAHLKQNEIFEIIFSEELKSKWR